MPSRTFQNIKNKEMEKIVKSGIIAVAILILSISQTTFLHAQPNPGPGQQGGGSSGPDGPTVPFDGGMSLMLAASGISYVAKKLGRNKR